MKVISIFILLLGFLILGCIADFKLGKLAYKKSHRRRLYPERLGAIELITNGADLFSHYFQDLHHAKHTIHVLFYIVKKDPFSEKFFDTLIEQAHKGVQIKLLLDWVGSRGASRRIIRKARKAGIEIIFCHRPRLPFLFFTLQQRNHRKITIIDGKVGYLGGYNVGKEYIDLDPYLTPWRDYHLRMEGDGVQDLESEFAIDWKRAGGDAAVGALSAKVKVSGTMRHRFVPTEGIEDGNHLLGLLRLAKQSIILGSPYFIPPERLMKELEDALSRGVKVTVIVPEKSDHLLVKEASYRYLRRILALGGKVCHYHRGFFHAKVIVIDEAICDIGTANLDRRSIELNHELNCFIYDPALVADVLAAIRMDIDFSTSLKMEDLSHFPLSVRFREWAAKQIECLL